MEEIKIDREFLIDYLYDIHTKADITIEQMADDLLEIFEKMKS